MNQIKGQRLYVNLGASQVRKRLRGFGHGVRKIQTAGRNQAVIIHTASGDHLRELRTVLADVLRSVEASHEEIAGGPDTCRERDTDSGESP